MLMCVCGCMFACVSEVQIATFYGSSMMSDNESKEATTREFGTKVNL